MRWRAIVRRRAAKTTMTSRPSDSEPSSAFHRLHERVQRWIWQQRWDALRDVQEAATHAILEGRGDVIISAATASGKTEAAFLPICSSLVDDARGGVRALYVGPLKALINDQFARLEQLCETLDIPVHRWHGDVAATRKRAAFEDPGGILLITPESLEALFVHRGHLLSRGALRPARLRRRRRTPCLHRHGARTSAPIPAPPHRARARPTCASRRAQRDAGRHVDRGRVSAPWLR